MNRNELAVRNIQTFPIKKRMRGRKSQTFVEAIIMDHICIK